MSLAAGDAQVAEPVARGIDEGCLQLCEEIDERGIAGSATTAQRAAAGAGELAGATADSPSS